MKLKELNLTWFGLNKYNNVLIILVKLLNYGFMISLLIVNHVRVGRNVNQIHLNLMDGLNVLPTVKNKKLVLNVLMIIIQLDQRLSMVNLCVNLIFNVTMDV
jgi:hypothetical protein